VFFEFPNDPITHTLRYQFMWGSSVMVVPITSPNVSTVRAYFPRQATWFSMSEAHKYGERIGSGYQTVRAPHDTPLPVFLRAGSIILKQRPSITTTQTRSNEFQLMAAIASDTDSFVAYGFSYWDDGESVVEDINAYPVYKFRYQLNVGRRISQLAISVQTPKDNSSLPLPTLNALEILGFPYQPSFSSLSLNGAPIAVDTNQSSYDSVKKILRIIAVPLINFSTGGNQWNLNWAREQQGSADTTVAPTTSASVGGTVQTTPAGASNNVAGIGMHVVMIAVALFIQ